LLDLSLQVQLASAVSTLYQSFAMGSTEDAVALKEKGNKAFKEHDWPAAIDFYTQAIEANPNEPSFYTNRAQGASEQARRKRHASKADEIGPGMYQVRAIRLGDSRCLKGARNGLEQRKGMGPYLLGAEERC